MEFILMVSASHFIYSQVVNRRFFDNMVGDNVLVCNKSLSSANGGMQEITLSSAKIQNMQLKDVYFVVNPGGTKANEITHLQTIYVDVDAGRDANNKFFNKKIVDRFKGRVLKRITELTIQPSYVVETRNGYQIYFKIIKIPNNQKNLETYKIIQNKLYNFFADFGADNKVQKINQLLRLPGFNWCKKWEGLPTFPVIVSSDYHSGKTYDISELGKAFQNESVTKKPTKKDYKPSYEKYTDISSKKSYEKVNGNGRLVVGKSKRPTDIISEHFLKEVESCKNVSAIIDTCDFLEEVSKILHYSNHKFLGKQALELVQKLKTNMTLE